MVLTVVAHESDDVPVDSLHQRKNIGGLRQSTSFPELIGKTRRRGSDGWGVIRVVAAGGVLGRVTAASII